MIKAYNKFSGGTMKKLIKNILKHRILIIIISILLIVFGLYSYKQIPKQEMPDIEALYGYVQVVAPGLSAKEIQSQIAVKVEGVVEEYSGVNSYTTTSYENVSITVIEMSLGDRFAEETLENIKTDVLNINFDDSVTDIMIVTDINTAEIIYAIHSDTATELELKNIAKELKIELKSIDNVSKINIDSAYSEEIIVEINYRDLNELPLTIMDIFTIILANGIEIPLGNIEDRDGTTSSITIDSNYESIEEIQDLIIYADETKVYTISDIASVKKMDTKGKKTYEFNGETAAFVEMFFDDNIDYTVIGDDVDEVVDEFRDTIDNDITISAMVYSPDHVKNQVNQVMLNLIQCIMIVIVIVLLGLGVRNSLTIAITIPVTVLFTIGILYLLGSDLQLMSIAGLIVSIGIIVDNSIVISEATQHELDRGRSTRKACVKAIRKNSLPVLTSTLTTIAAFVTLLFLPGIAGDVSFTLPLTIIISITISYIVAITLTPTLASFFLKPNAEKAEKLKQKRQGHGKIFNAFYSKTFKMAVVLCVLAFGLLGFLVVNVLNNLEIDVLPKTEKSVVYIDYESSEVNDKDAAYEAAKEIESVVLMQKNVINYGFSQGGDLPKFYITLSTVSTLPRYGRFFIEYDCKSSELNDYIIDLEEDLRDLETDTNYSVNRLELSQPAAPVQIVFTSYDFDDLQKVTKEIFADVEKLKSYKTGKLVYPLYKTNVSFDIRRDVLNQYGLSVVEVEQQIALAVNGIYDSLYKLDDNVLNVRVSTNIYTDDALLKLKIKSTTGAVVELSELVKFKEIKNLEYISQYNGKPSITLDAYMEDGYSTYDLENDIKEIIDELSNEDITPIYKGDNELTNELMVGMTIALIVALFAIYIIMYFQFKSFVQPLIIFISIPLSFIGSLAILIIMDELITLTALLGIVSLVGIVVNNGILLVEYINNEREKGSSVYDSCLLAVRRRLRPIILSSLTTILGIAPLAIYGGDFFRPMAITFMGGLVTSTIMVLIMVPSLYYFTHKRKDLKIDKV